MFKSLLKVCSCLPACGILEVEVSNYISYFTFYNMIFWNIESLLLSNDVSCAIVVRKVAVILFV